MATLFGINIANNNIKKCKTCRQRTAGAGVGCFNTEKSELSPVKKAITFKKLLADSHRATCPVTGTVTQGTHEKENR